MNYLDFEKPLAEIEGKAEELRAMARANREMDVEKEAVALDRKAETLLRDIYKDLSPWRKCQVARHPDRPHCADYIAALFADYTPLAGDRNFADDHAVMGGLARIGDVPVMVIGHEKGNDTKTRIDRNFGMARPEGYRKAIRLMDLAHRFGLPLITLIDTPGAYPGLGAEERGQAEAIARSTHGRNARSPATPTDRTRWRSSTRCSPSSRRWRATARSPRTRPSSAGWRGSTTGR